MLLQGKQPTETPQKFWALFNCRIKSSGPFSASTVVTLMVRPERTTSAWSRDSMLLQGKQPTETPLTF